MLGFQQISIIAVVLLISIKQCVSLNCYDCGSASTADCKDPFNIGLNEGNDGECGPKQTHCVKFKTVAYLQDSGFITGKSRETVVESRMCIRRDGQKNGCVYVESDSGFYFECLCDTDMCNSGYSVLPNLTILLMAALGSIYLYSR